MQDYLKHYAMKLTARSPVHIGSGISAGKKEYIYMPWKNLVIMPNVALMHKELLMKNRTEYIRFMVENNRYTLSEWLKHQGYREVDYRRWVAYELDAGDVFMRDMNKQKGKQRGICLFMKDAYGLPYIPGSSIKGAIRTALLTWEIEKNPEKYNKLRKEIEQKSAVYTKKKWYLTKQTEQLESAVFHTLNREPKDVENALNSNMAGIIISDSDPISCEQLTLCQKVDIHIQGTERRLPVFFEVLKPGTEVFFDLTIDTSVSPYSIEDIMQAINIYQESCYKQFYSRFKRGTKEQGTLFIGGNAGFVSKTIIYPMMQQRAVEVTDNIFKVTLSKELYKNHERDISDFGIAPHVCKCTYYNRKLYDMGLAKIEQV